MTPHQHRLVKLRLAGLSYKEIGEKLKLSEAGIRYHFKAVFKELKIHRTAGLGLAYNTYRKEHNLSYE